MLKIILPAAMVVFLIADVVVYAGFRGYMKKHGDEWVEDNKAGIMRRIWLMAGLSLCVAALGALFMALYR